jgi:predicted thioredoxin/glutaredoxin
VILKEHKEAKAVIDVKHRLQLQAAYKSNRKKVLERIGKTARSMIDEWKPEMMAALTEDRIKDVWSNAE